MGTESWEAAPGCAQPLAARACYPLGPQRRAIHGQFGALARKPGIARRIRSARRDRV